METTPSLESQPPLTTVRATTKTTGTGARKATKPPKLRDSCDACAAGKVRCTQTKPVCMRCEKRGLICEYIATKRAGRPSQRSNKGRRTKLVKPSKDAQQNVVNILSPPSSHQATPWETSLEASPIHRGTSCSYENTHAHTISSKCLPTSALSSFLSLTASSSEIDGFFSGFGSSPCLEIATQDNISVTNCLDPISAPDSTYAASFFGLEDTCFTAEDLFSDTQMASLDTSPFDSGQSTSLLNLPRCCLMTALSFLSDMSPPLKNCARRGGSQTSDETKSQFPTIQSIVAKNERVLEAMENILQCACSQDGYLLTVLSLALFKVLDWYTEAAYAATKLKVGAHNTSDSSHLRRGSSQSVERISVEGEDSGRIAAQMVLGELHHVQRVVNNLSSIFKLQNSNNRNEMGIKSHNTFTDHIEAVQDREITLPFSTQMLDQLEADLRGRLRNVSSRLVDILRRN
jgi:hypothetical protein